MQSLEVSGAVRPIYGSLGVKRLTRQSKYVERNTEARSWNHFYTITLRIFFVLFTQFILDIKQCSSISSKTTRSFLGN